MRKSILIPLALIAISLGCASIKTTVLDRSECGHLHKNPHCPLKGIPVMLRVPTHIDVEIVQIDYWHPNKAGDLELVMANGQPFYNREVRTELIQTEQMFLVDPKRPASGTGIYGFFFRGDKIDSTDVSDSGKGYLEGISYQSVDSTLKDSFALYDAIRTGGILRALGIQQDTSATSVTTSDDIVGTKRTIAYRRFNINSPSIESDIECFLEDYLNRCGPSCEINSIVHQ